MITVALAPTATPSTWYRSVGVVFAGLIANAVGHVDIVVLAGDHCGDAAERLAGCPHPAASPKPGSFVIVGRHNSRTMQ
jgi:hypothetical protein